MDPLPRRALAGTVAVGVITAVLVPAAALTADAAPADIGTESEPAEPLPLATAERTGGAWSTTSRSP